MAARVAKKKLILAHTKAQNQNIVSSSRTCSQQSDSLDNKAFKLPMNFAEDILQLEIEVDINSIIDLKVIHKLIELYTLGVGYYESIGDSKYQYFHKKMNTLMMKQNVIDSMNVASITQVRKRAATMPQNQILVFQEGSKGPIPSSPNKQKDSEKELVSSISLKSNDTVGLVQKKEQEVTTETTKCNQPNLNKKKEVEDIIKMNIVYGMHENVSQSRSLLKMHQNEQERKQTIITKQIGSQMDEIKRRLELRKNNSALNKALSLPTNTDSDTSFDDADILPSRTTPHVKHIHNDIILEEEENKREEDDSRGRSTSRENVIQFLQQQRTVQNILEQNSRRKTSLSKNTRKQQLSQRMRVRFHSQDFQDTSEAKPPPTSNFSKSVVLTLNNQKYML